MDSTLLNQRAKFGAKIFRPSITLLVLGHFFKPHPVHEVLCLVIVNVNMTKYVQPKCQICHCSFKL